MFNSKEFVEINAKTIQKKSIFKQFHKNNTIINKLEQKF